MLAFGLTCVQHPRGKELKKRSRDGALVRAYWEKGRWNKRFGEGAMGEHRCGRRASDGEARAVGRRNLDEKTFEAVLERE